MQRKIRPLIQASDLVAAVTHLVHFQIGAEEQRLGHLFDGETHRLRRGIKPPIGYRPAHLAVAARKQFCRRAEIDYFAARVLHSGLRHALLLTYDDRATAFQPNSGVTRH